MERALWHRRSGKHSQDVKIRDMITMGRQGVPAQLKDLACLLRLKTRLACSA